MNTTSNREFKEEEGTILRDFFADLLHYCRLNRLELYDFLHKGWMSFSVQTTPEEEVENDSEREAGADSLPTSAPRLYPINVPQQRDCDIRWPDHRS